MEGGLSKRNHTVFLLLKLIKNFTESVTLGNGVLLWYFWSPEMYTKNSGGGWSWNNSNSVGG